MNKSRFDALQRIALVNILKRSAHFETIVRMLYDGISAKGCARWAVAQTGPESQGWSCSYWEKLTLALVPYITKAERKIAESPKDRTLPSLIARMVGQQVEELTGEDWDRHTPEEHRQLFREIGAISQERTAEGLLHFLFIESLWRLVRLREFEEKSGVFLPDTLKQLESMRRIGAGIGDIEWMKTIAANQISVANQISGGENKPRSVIRRFDERQRVDRMNIVKRSPLFQEIIQRLHDGDSAKAVARWAAASPESQGWGFSYWEKLVLSLVPEVKKAERTIAQFPKNSTLPPPITSVVSQQVEESIGEVLSKHTPEEYRQVFRDIRRIIQERNAELLLHFAFIENEKRLDELCELEKKTGVFRRDTIKQIESMRRIAVELGRIKYRSDMRGTRASEPVNAGEAKRLGPIGQAMSKLNAVDRNLFREANILLFNMAKDAAGGVFEPKELTTTNKPEETQGNTNGWQSKFMALRLTHWQLTPREINERRFQQLSELLAKMSPEARAEFDKCKPLFANVQNTCEVHEVDFNETPVDVKTFCEHPYFLGSILRGISIHEFSTI